MRLIDANRLFDAMRITGQLVAGVGEVVNIIDVFEQIKDAPTIDAVEVVRCRDCIYWAPHTQCGFDEDDDKYHDYCRLLIPADDYYAYTRKPDDYCSYGEYKGGEK